MVMRLRRDDQAKRFPRTILKMVVGLRRIVNKRLLGYRMMIIIKTKMIKLILSD